MSKRFLSNAQHSVDKQGRASLPTPFRTVAGELDPAVTGARKRGERPPQPRIYLMPGYLGEKCIVGHSEIGWRRLNDQFAALPDEAMKDMLSYAVVAQASAAPVDDAGRILIPGRLRTRYGIGEKAHFVGKSDYFEIWNDKDFEAKMAREEAAWEAGAAAARALLSGRILPPESLEDEE